MEVNIKGLVFVGMAIAEGASVSSLLHHASKPVVMNPLVKKLAIATLDSVISTTTLAAATIGYLGSSNKAVKVEVKERNDEESISHQPDNEPIYKEYDEKIEDKENNQSIDRLAGKIFTMAADYNDGKQMGPIKNKIGEFCSKKIVEPLSEEIVKGYMEEMIGNNEENESFKEEECEQDPISQENFSEEATEE